MVAALIHCIDTFMHDHLCTMHVHVHIIFTHTHTHTHTHTL